MTHTSHPDTCGDHLSPSQAKDDSWLGYDLFILTISVLAIASLAYTTLLKPTVTTAHVLETADLIVCVLFFADFIVCLVRAENR